MDLETRYTFLFGLGLVVGIMLGAKAARSGERVRLDEELDRLRDRLDRRR